MQGLVPVRQGKNFVMGKAEVHAFTTLKIFPCEPVRNPEIA